jgi:hypothetical protein
MGRALILFGLLAVGVGLLINLGYPIGRLPGDFTLRRGSLTLYIPLATSLLASVVLTLVAAIISYFSKR